MNKSQLAFKRVGPRGILIPRGEFHRWHCWLFERGYWLGDFCAASDGAYSAGSESEGEYVRIIPPKSGRG